MGINMPARAPEPLERTPDFSALLEGLERELQLSIEGEYWISLVGLRIFETSAKDGSTPPPEVVRRLHDRLPELIQETIRTEATDTRPRDVYMPLGDVFFVVFPRTPEAKVLPPLRRILDAWREALAKAAGLEGLELRHTLHIGIVSWGPAVRSTNARELLGFGAFMVDEAGRQAEDTSLHQALGVTDDGTERIHVARFRWL